MPRRITVGTAGLVFHVVNRGVRRLRLFDHDGDYRAWLQAFAEAQARVAVDVFAYCLMPNHFHLVLRPSEDGQLSEFMRLGTVTHSMRWHAYRGTGGTGAVYQGRFRAFPVQTNSYFYNVCRYVEANPVRAALAKRAEEWNWSSLAARNRGRQVFALAEWPLQRPADWAAMVNEIPSASDLTAIRRSVIKSMPFGEPNWARASADSLGLTKSFRSPGREKRPGLISEK
jgi:putative transposase